MAPTAPKTNRMAKYRGKLKSNPVKWKQHLEKERERDKIRRLKAKDKVGKNKKLLEESRKKIRKRVRLHRERKKQGIVSNRDDCTSNIGSYKCVQSFGRAVNKTKQSLPKSPSKKLAVLRKLADEVVGPVKYASSPTKRTRESTLTSEVKSFIKEFFCNDEISWQAPGKQDVKSVKNPVSGERNHIQKRYMIMSIGEAFEQFKDSHPDVTIGKSTFFSLRPQHVLPLADTPHNVCVCKYHCNCINLIEAVSKHIPDFPKTHKELLTVIACNIDNENCMMGICSDCSNVNSAIQKLTQSQNLKHSITWQQWESDVDGRAKLRCIDGKCEVALEELMKKLAHFKIHSFVKKVQSEYFQSKKKSLTENSAVLQIDFAENYSMISQDEIQSAHWSHSQISIFTCGLWLCDNVFKPYIIVSNDLSHNKYAVCVFLDRIIEEIKKEMPAVKHLLIFSDNCTGQFKNRFVLSNICHMQNHHGLEVEWTWKGSC